MRDDPRQFYDEHGDIKPVHTWTPDYSGVGKMRRVASVELKFWDKNATLGHVVRHLGMFEKDNVQKMPNLNVQLLLVGPPE